MRTVRIGVWLAIVPFCIYLYFFRSDFIQAGLHQATTTSVILGYMVYLLLGSVRGFTLIPATNLILLGIPFFQPVPLLFLSLVGILVSSISIYYFAESLHLDELLAKSRPGDFEKLTAALQRHEFPIIIGWSFFPLLPTDLICYACGILKVNVRRFALGVLLGEGTICGIYIFLGDSILRFIGWR